jgi:phage terminase small subunit
MAKHHYVYALTDPRQFGKPFYIGKGSGDRKVQHFRSVSKEMCGSETSDKFKIIKAIRDAGLQPGAQILSHHDEEEQALTEERKVIAEIGLDNLINKSIGGEGVKATKKKIKTTVTEKMERFCQLMVAGTNGSASDCYRLAYEPKKATKKSINEMVSELMRNPKITSRLDELRAPVVERTRFDLEWCLGRQNDAADLAEETGNAGALTGAVREIGKLSDVYPSEKAELTLKGDELAVRLQQGRARLAEEDT